MVRRELAFNPCRFRPDTHDRYAGFPDWAQRPLAEHAEDPRAPCYSPEQLEASETDDPPWNAAMTDMRRRGLLPNGLPMYWGKKIPAWSATPEEAFASAVRLNDRYFRDGRPPMATPMGRGASGSTIAAGRSGPSSARYAIGMRPACAEGSRSIATSGV